MNRILGIDPGLSGGLALLSDDGLIVEKMPVVKIGKKSRIDVRAFGDLVYSWLPDIALLEEQQVMPGQGSVSGLTIGINYGALLSALIVLRVPHEEIRPQTWKKSLRVTANKDDARYRAIQLFPNNSSDFARKSDDGLAEAALLAYYYKTRGN